MKKYLPSFSARFFNILLASFLFLSLAASASATQIFFDGGIYNTPLPTETKCPSEATMLKDANGQPRGICEWEVPPGVLQITVEAYGGGAGATPPSCPSEVPTMDGDIGPASRSEWNGGGGGAYAARGPITVNTGDKFYI